MPRTTLIILTRDSGQQMKQAGLEPPIRKLEKRDLRETTPPLQGVPAGQHNGFALHVLPGEQQEARWYTEGGYDAIAEKLFGLLDVDKVFYSSTTATVSGGFRARLRPSSAR